MGKLAHLIQQQDQSLDLAKSLANSRDGIDIWLASLQKLTGLMETVTERLEIVEETLSTMEIPDASPAVEQLMDMVGQHREAGSGELKQALQSIRAAIAGIKMPDIPEHKETDLEPVLQAIRNIQQTTVVSAERPAHSWEFEIERDRFGLIKCVTAKPA